MDFHHSTNLHHVDSDDGDSSLSGKLRGISSRNSFDSDYCRFKDPIPFGDPLVASTSSSEFDRQMSSSRETNNTSKERSDPGLPLHSYPVIPPVTFHHRRMDSSSLPEKVPITGHSPTLTSPSPISPLPRTTIAQMSSTTTTVRATVGTIEASSSKNSTGTPIVTDIAARSPLRLISEVKGASQSQESQVDSGHGSSHGLTQPAALSSEFQQFYKSEFETNPATESSKLLSTPTKKAERDNEERPPSPIIGLSTTSKQEMQRAKEQAANTTWKFLSLLYGLVLIILGLAFPASEIFSVKVRPMFYQVYYVFLFGASLLFLCFAYIFLLQTGRRSRKPLLTFTRKGDKGYRMETVEAEEDLRSGEGRRVSLIAGPSGAKTGSFYLRMGALLFGIGSMIYSCLEFGQYFEYDIASECNDIMNALVPALRFLFAFVQLYFIFLIAKIRIDRCTTFVRFGLMHMIATNICVWLAVVIGETRHELELTLSEPDRITPPGFEDHPYPLGLRWNFTDQTAPATVEYKKPLNMYMKAAADALAGDLTHGYPKSCRAQTLIGNILQKASLFLFPCVVEYSLICAAMLFVMWLRISTKNKSYIAEETSFSTMSLGGTSKRQRYTVDCNGATRGLFAGILVIVLTIISMILFFVWIWRREYYTLAVFQSYCVEIATFTVTFIAVCVAIYQVRDLKFEASEGALLNDLLLIVSQCGVYIFCAFILIAGHHTVLEDIRRGDLFAMLSALLEVLQATLQTLFLLDATRRRPFKQEHLRNKPGRELVTFLLVCNFGLWAIDSLEIWKQQLYPAQTRFYGSWAWTMVMNASMPLMIFYRFHSSVCLSEVWKKAWKLKSRPSTPVAP